MRSPASLGGEACAHPKVPPCPPSPRGQEIRCSEGRWCLVGLQVNFYSTFSMEREAPGALSKPSAARAERSRQPRLRGSGHGVYRSSSASCPRSCGFASAPGRCAAGSPAAEGCLAVTPSSPRAGQERVGHRCSWLHAASQMVPVRFFPCFNGRLVLPLLCPILTGAAGHRGMVKAT